MKTSLTRRELFKAAAGAVALASAGPVLAAGRGVFVSMRNLNGFWAGGGTPWTFEWPELLRLAARAGYGGVDLQPAVITAMMKDGQEKVRGLFSELKLKRGFVNATANPFARDAATFQASMKTFDEFCGFVAAIGFERMMTVMYTSSDTPKDEMRKIALDRARAMGEVLARHKLRLGIENLAPLHFRKQFKYPFIYSVPDTVAFCKEAGPSWGLCLDAWHWHHAGGTVKDILDAGKSQIVVVHIEDAKQQPPEDVRDNMRLLPGEGVIDLNGFLKALKKIGYEGQIQPEPLSRFPAGTSADEVAKQCLAATLAVMKKAGLKPA